MPKAPPHREADDDSKPDKIPRPPNAWIIYRGDRLTEWKASRSPNDPPVKQADISRLIARRWKEENDVIKLEYEKRAAIAKAEHKKRFPDYKYNPMSKEAKEKMRAEEKEAKKRAREEAKAAKMAPPRPSYVHPPQPSYPSPPSGSNVKLENMESPPAESPAAETESVTLPRMAVEPIERGCGPSPPIDYDPQSPSSSSISSLSASSSSSSSASARSSPLPSSSQLAPSPHDASPAWHPHIPSPLSSSPTQAPPPAYPSTFAHSPVPSRQSSYNLHPSSSSTPSESPPSYSDGENWQPGPPDSAFHPFTPLPDFQSNWNTPSQDPLLLPNVPDVNFSLPPFDPLLTLPQDDQFNADALSAGAIFDLSAQGPEMGSANSPPTELELDVNAFNQHFATIGQQPAFHPLADQLAPMLDMPELHETMEDRAAEAGLPTPGVAQGSTLEDFAGFVNAHPQDAISLADPDFYATLGRQILAQFPQLAASLIPQAAPPQYMQDPNNVFSPVDFAPMQPQPQLQPEDQAFDASLYQMFMQQQPQLAMPTPMRPIPVTDISAVSTPVQREPSYTYPNAPLAQPAPAPVAAAPMPATESAAPAPPRYVPPRGAAMAGRRRVAQPFIVPRMSHRHSDSE